MKTWVSLLATLALAGCAGESSENIEVGSGTIIRTGLNDAPSAVVSATDPDKEVDTGAYPETHPETSPETLLEARENADTGASVHSEIVQGVCVNCHTDGGMAGSTALVFASGKDATVEAFNLATLDAMVLSAGARGVLEKARGFNHGGGQQLTGDSDAYASLVTYLEDRTGDQFTADEGDEVDDAVVTLENPAVTYRRASLMLTGTIPSAEQLEAVASLDDEGLRRALLAMMNGEGFRKFLKRGANDQLLVRSAARSGALYSSFDRYYPVFNRKYQKQELPDRDYARAVMTELAEAPLELIAHVVQNDFPYTEILTADYTMVSRETARVFKTGLSPAANEFVPAVNKGQRVAGGNQWFPVKNWSESVAVSIPHAGILTEPAFLFQYRSSGTNRNRARSRWTYQHFLGFDIETSAARMMATTSLHDKDNPTLKNEVCTVCHDVLDPVAAAFKDFGNLGIFRDAPGGADALDKGFRKTDLYSPGDTWYSDMRPPGFEGHPIEEDESALQQLAHAIVEDPRFAQGVVQFWWPALFGEPMFAEHLTAAQQDARVETLGELSQAFVASNYNLRSLLGDILMSKWFRADRPEGNTPGDAISDTAVYNGGKRLLTPEELVDKTASVAGVFDDDLAEDFYLLYGGIDSFEITQRLRHFNHVMLRVAERHALVNACTVVATEFNSPQRARRLFTMVERNDIPGPTHDGKERSTIKIRQQMVQLIERLHGRELAQSDALILDYTRLFIDLRNRYIARGAAASLVESGYRCHYDAGGVPRRVWGVDAEHTLKAWRGVIAALMTDFDYLFE